MMRRAFPRMLRFGLSSLFAAMLLVASAGGWWKFHRELYVEERGVIAALKARGGKVTFHRGNGETSWLAVDPEDDDAIPWHAPLIPPIRHLFIDSGVSDELRDAAARLPRLEMLSVDHQPTTTGASTPLSDLSRLLGRGLPTAPESTLDVAVLDEELPLGQSIDSAEAARVAAAIRAAWFRPDAVPARKIEVSHTSSIAFSRAAWSDKIVVDVLDGERRHYFLGMGQPISLEMTATYAKGEMHGVDRDGAAWRRRFRSVSQTRAEFDDVYRRFPNDDYPYLAENFHGWRMTTRALRDMPRFELTRVSRVDDVRYRVDFAPFDARREEPGELEHNAADPKILEWSCVARSDLDWVLEQSRIVQRIHFTQTPPAGPSRYERRTFQRFRREGEYVVLVERLMTEGVGPKGAVAIGVSDRTLRAIEIDPEFDDRIFDPLALDPEPWAEPRPLPWLRWYRVTFAIACGLSVFLLVRAILSALRCRRSAAKDSASPAEASG